MLLLINVGLGLGVALITALLGIPDPLLWGTLYRHLELRALRWRDGHHGNALNHIDG